VFLGGLDLTHLSTKQAPGFVRFRYSGATIPHTCQFGIKFSGVPTPGTEPNLETKSGGTVGFVAGVTDFIDLAFQSQFNADTTFGFADIYSVDPTTGLRTFIFTTNIDLVGSNVAENVPLVQGVFVFKTSAGKPLKVYVMEAVYAADARNIGVVPADERQDMLDYVLGDDNILYGTTDAWPIAFQTFTSKENDVLRRRSGFYNA